MITPRRTLMALSALLAIATACNEHGLIPIDRAIEGERLLDVTTLETSKVDILWVVDNSHSMCEEQADLTANFDSFIEGLTSINADFHIAVVTTDMAVDNGRFRTAPGVIEDCPARADIGFACPDQVDPVVRAADYRLDPEDPNSLVDTQAVIDHFRCIATAGVTGSGFEKGLDAAATALSIDLLQTVNAGFRREDAWLAIIFLSDENDCSEGNTIDLGGFGVNPNYICEWVSPDLTPVSEFVDRILAVPGAVTGSGDERVLVAGILGPDDGTRVSYPDAPRVSCVGARGEAYSGYRYIEFIDAFGDRGVLTDICNDDFGVALSNIADVIRANLARCLPTPPSTCDSAEDCAEGQDCVAAGSPEGSLRVCSDFTVVVEVADAEGNWSALSPSTAALAACPAEGEGAAYCVSYGTPRCPTGVGVEFTPGNEPAAGTDLRLRYPVRAVIPE